ncbi:MAG TPA: hypothetical protein VIJ28_13335, partial [Chloroflexota bacterium]
MGALKGHIPFIFLEWGRGWGRAPTARGGWGTIAVRRAGPRRRGAAERGALIKAARTGILCSAAGHQLNLIGDNLKGGSLLAIVTYVLSRRKITHHKNGGPFLDILLRELGSLPENRDPEPGGNLFWIAACLLGALLTARAFIHGNGERNEFTTVTGKARLRLTADITNDHDLFHVSHGALLPLLALHVEWVTRRRRVP